MEKYKNIIGSQEKLIIIICLCITIIFPLIIAITAILSLTSTEKQMEHSCIEPSKDTLAQSQIQKSAQSIMKNIFLSCAANNTERKNEILSDVEEDRKIQQEQLDILKYSITNSAELNLISDLERLMAEAAQAENEVIEHSMQKDVQGALSAFESSYAPASQKVLDLLENISFASGEKDITSYQNVKNFNNTAIIILIALTALNLIFSICLCILITRFFKNQLHN